MEIRTIQKGFKAFDRKFEPFEWDSKHSNPNLNHSKGIRSIRMEIRTIRMGFEAFEWKFESFKRDSKDSNGNSNHSKGIRSIRIAFKRKFEPFERDPKHSNPNSNHSKGVKVRVGVRLGLGLGPCEMTQKWPFLPKNDLKIMISVIAVSKTTQNLQRPW